MQKNYQKKDAKRPIDNQKDFSFMNYTERNGLIIILIAGGDKTTQEREIAKARQLAKEWKM